jgi:hypothetical protein
MLLTLLVIIWVLIWALTVVDIVRRRDLATTAKVLWALGVLILPVIGIIVYLVARPGDPGEPRFPDASPSDASPERFRDRHPT